MSRRIVINIHEGGSTYQITQDQLTQFADQYGLEQVASGRYSSLFIGNLFLLQRQNGIDPFEIIDEIKSLEGLGPSCQTKPASQFTGKYLKGFWHKHFLSTNVSFIAHNIINQLAGNKFEDLANQVFGHNQNSVITEEMINDLSHRVVSETLENRANQENLTGEWIIFAKEKGKNYYLCIATHQSGDENIAQSIKLACVPQFPFLANYFF